MFRSVFSPVFSPVFASVFIDKDSPEWVFGEEADNTITHILIYGQSLSLGSSPLGTSVISAANPGHRMFNGGVRVHYDTSDLINEDNLLDPAQATSLVALAEQISPFALHMGETLASGMALKQTSRCLFSTTGRGGFTADNLSRLNGRLHFTNTYAAALLGSELAKADGYEYKVGPVIFKQGEADAATNNTKAAWKISVKEIRDDLAVHLVHATHTDTSNIDMVVDQQAAQVSVDTYGEIAVGAIELHRTVGNNIICAGPTYPEEFEGGTSPHFTANGYRNYGEKLGRVVAALEAGNGWNPCYITSVSRSTTTITVNIHVPSGALVMDTTLVNSVANSGFAYSGATITNVSITDTGASDNAGVIEITIDADAGGTLDFAYENGTSSWVGPVNGARGNIRDSESAVTANDGKNLYNWLCNDQWSVT